MKYLSILCLFLFTVSCEQEKVSQNELLGNWEWTSTYGSIAGIETTPENTGMEQSLEISEETISFFVDGEKTSELSYDAFESDTILGDNVLRKFISYDGDTRRYTLQNDSLSIFDLCADCYDSHFIR
ncbi:hypothetical protein N9B82_03235 [Saprospiraceae bacterium]|nr:hypothetical protein [Saprospiraceae bacterium]